MPTHTALNQQGALSPALSHLSAQCIPHLFVPQAPLIVRDPFPGRQKPSQADGHMHLWASQGVGTNCSEKCKGVTLETVTCSVHESESFLCAQFHFIRSPCRLKPAESFQITGLIEPLSSSWGGCGAVFHVSLWIFKQTKSAGTIWVS